MTTRMLRNAIVATALVGAIAAPSAMACTHGGGGSSGPPPYAGTYKQGKNAEHNGSARHVHRGDRGDCNGTPPVVTPPVVTPPVVPPVVNPTPPTGPLL